MNFLSQPDTSKYTQDQLIEVMRRGAAAEYLEYGREINPLLLLTIPATIAPITPEDVWQACCDNEDGDARLYIRIFRERRVYDHQLEHWFIFDGHSWRQDKIDQTIGDMEEVIKEYVAEAKLMGKARAEAEQEGRRDVADRLKGQVEDLLKRVRHLRSLDRKKRVLALARSSAYSLAVTGDDWDKLTGVLACPNGVLDLKTGVLRPGRPADWIKTRIPTAWEGLDAPCPGWEKFLLEIFDGDADLVAYVQRLLGYAMTGWRTENVLPIMHGQGRNGKTTLLETIMAVLGAVSGPIQAETLLEQKHTQSGSAASPDIVDLRGRRVVWASESGEGRKLNESRVKWLTGGDTLKGRPIHGKEIIEFKPTHTLFLLTNHRPHASGDDYALWKRIRLIPFNLSFVEAPAADNERLAVKGLQEVLLQEAPGILAWLVRGCLAWQADGLGLPESVRAATSEYQSDEDMIGTFLEDCAIKDADCSVPASDLYNVYKKWTEINGARTLGNNRFGKVMKKRLESVKYGSIYYKGIRLQEGLK